MDKQLTKNFKLSEFTCKCGCGKDDISLELVGEVQKIRELYGKPIRITSGLRCIDHNRNSGGRDNSAHLSGLAADIGWDNVTDRHRLLTIIIGMGWRRIGIAKSFVHIDIDNSKAQDVIWTY